MTFIGFDREDDAIEWAKTRIGISGPVGLCRALSSVNASGDFELVVVLSNFSSCNIDMHVAAAPGSHLASPRAIVAMFNAIFSYAFRQLGAQRVTGLVAASNAQARRFDEHLGFVLEGVMRKAFKGDDLCVYGFLAEEFSAHKWYRGK